MKNRIEESSEGMNEQPPADFTEDMVALGIPNGHIWLWIKSRMDMPVSMLLVSCTSALMISSFVDAEINVSKRAVIMLSLVEDLCCFVAVLGC